MEEDILKKYDLNKPYNYILYLAIVLTTAGLILTFTQTSKMPLARLYITILGYLHAICLFQNLHFQLCLQNSCVPRTQKASYHPCG